MQRSGGPQHQFIRSGGGCACWDTTAGSPNLLFVDGHVLVDLPYAERRRRLERLALRGSHWQVPAYDVGDGAALLGLARAQVLAGVVAKRLDSPYLPGERSPDWVETRP
ncbi:MAG TPA: hypothetical protein VF244_09665 [Acidimicrobiales bacterium]